ncbi:hypothetical protein FOXYS1_10060 [Fusarium oxysporum]|uniref:Enoyl reductase (ER) domain-containing protein n=1 Tax=Fusarium oxysporum TaxID=5507 RepID=A0A8H5EH07_FUSOX|nr:hypothetical protein FOXYS1_10060 [Fusarium oxysporum]
MFAWQYISTKAGIEKNFVLNRNVPVPSLPKKGSAVLVKVSSVSINPQDYKRPEILFGRFSLPPPSTPGTDFVGIVHETTDPAFAKGDIIFGSIGAPRKQGALAEYVVTETDQVANVPIALLEPGFELAPFACIGTAGLTALQAFRGLESGAHVFVNGGSGGVGTFCISIAKNVAKCGKVVVTCSAANTDLVKGLNADEVIDYRNQNVVQTLIQSAQHTRRKFDLVIDTVGNDPNLYWKSHLYLADDGRFVQIGIPDLGSLWDVVKMSIWPAFLGGGRRKYSILVLNMERKDMEEMGEWVASGKIKVVIDEVYDLDGVPRAFSKLKSGRAKGKLVITLASK